MSAHTSMTGRRLGVYEIQGLLGVGGMGEVYRGRDTRLQRDVAIKVLPAAVANDPERLARFEREAQVLASLSHPGIATIYGVEDGPAEAGDSMRAIVMDLVDGETLAERIPSGPVPVDEALRIARQIADALDSAHEKGGVHRDLTPANIKIAPDGTVKILDFGLAKLATSDANATAMATREGVVMGTPAYMSPEQARGQAVDKRTDIWAFGCVLFEMLSGTHASDVPDWQTLPAGMPPRLERLLTRCLERDPRRRARDIGDVRVELDELLAPPAAVAGTAPALSPALARRVLAWGGALVVAAVAGGLIVWSTRMAITPPPGITRLAIPLALGELLATGTAPLAMSPDGRYVAYHASRAGRRVLYLRALAELDAREISDDAAGYPFFSPGSDWLGFFSDGKLKKAPVRGGPAVTLADASGGRGASWGDDGYIVFAPVSRASLLRVPEDGGNVEPLTTLDEGRGETSHRFPAVLPGGRAVIYRAEGSGRGNGAIAVYSLDTRTQRILLPDGGANPHYSSTGHLVYLNGRDLMAVRFSLDRLVIAGAPVRLLENVQAFTLSNAGTLVYSAAVEATSSLVWVDRDGAAVPLPGNPRGSLPRLSHDGRRVVSQIDEAAGRRISTYAFDTGASTQLTFEGANLWPLWTPDGAGVIYASNRPGTVWDIFWRRADGTGGETPLVTRPQSQVARDISRDGEWLAYDEPGTDTGQDVWMMSLRVPGPARPVARTSATERHPAFSPDSRWIAYVSNESGRAEIYVRPVAEGSGKWLVSGGGGIEPRWSPAGSELFYRDGEKMMVVDVRAGGAFATGTPKLLFDAPYLIGPTGTNYDVAPDGQRFLMVASTVDTSPSTLTIVSSWFDELQRLVP
jgi:serine/threonine-protein kinase